VSGPSARRARANLVVRWRTMGAVAIKMMFYDKLKLAGTLLGVVFAVVLSNQQAGTFLGLVYKNVMFTENATADVWILPPGAETFAAGRVLSTSDAMQAKAMPGVAWAEPLLVTNGTIKLPGGGTEAVTVIGVKHPYEAGGPWNLVAADRSVLARPDTMIFEDGDRENLGALNLGSIREISGRNVTVGGFTWGLIPFGPSYAFADFDLARELAKTPQDRASFVLVKLAPGTDVATFKEALAARVPESVVVTKSEFRSMTVKNLLFKTALGITFGTSTVFGLIVGFVIVSLSMFSSVVDNIREFGTLKAIGATNLDLMMLLFVQAVMFGVIGSVVGLALVSQMAKGIRSAKLALNLPPIMTFGTGVLMVLLCVFASSLALIRLRRVEPAMVFR
jgi:putative ABC transport system permease protein